VNRFIRLFFVIVCLLAAPAGSLAATTIELPLTLRTALLQYTLAQHINPEPGKPAVLYQEGPYRYLHSEHPRLEIRSGRPHFSAHIVASLGMNVLGVMPMGMKWSGSIDMTLSPYVDEQWQLRYHIVDSSLYDDAGAKPMMTGLVWDLVKKFLHPRLEKYTLDLSPPQQEVVGFLRACASPAEAAQLDATLKTITAGQLRVDANGIIVPLLMSVAEGPAPEPAPLPAEAPLTPVELENFQKVLEPWDAFLVFVIKNAGMDFVDAQMRDQLFDLLISGRYQLLPILTGETRPEGSDPLRALFVEAWQKLRLIIEDAEQRGLIQQQPIRYMTFVNAGDALLTLDAAAPQLGMQISSDGLRRLARTLQPSVAEDPLRFGWEVDPVLRDLFRFGPEPEPESVMLAPSLSRRLLDFLIPLAYAAEGDGRKTLDRWVPQPEELAAYQQQLGQLLQSIADEELQRGDLDSRYGAVFQHLVPATALMESCWRQFVDVQGQVTYLRSQAGSIGLMQINQNVWRGFYDLERLRWEVAYNGRAGVQILLRYLKQYGIAVAEKSNNPNYAPRATYSVYNAGPKAARRFMKKDSTAREKRVDERFWTLYQGVAAGGKVDLSACNVDMPAP
jgi:hypothetical protein